MKTTIRSPHRLGLLLVAVLILGSLCLPAAAAETPDTYRISMELTFYDSESVEYTAEDYGACAFLIQDSSARYLVAKLDEKTGIYQVTGTVAAEAAATRFRGGNNASKPAMLQIVGLPADTHTITPYEVLAGFQLFKPFIVEISLDGATVDGHKVEISNNNLGDIQIVFTRGFNLPGMCLYCEWLSGFESSLNQAIYAICLVMLSAGFISVYIMSNRKTLYKILLGCSLGCIGFSVLNLLLGVMRSPLLFDHDNVGYFLFKCDVAVDLITIILILANIIVAVSQLWRSGKRSDSRTDPA